MARGFLIGLTELVPGVSGSTIALIVGVYTDILRSVHHVVEAGKALLRGRGLTAVRTELSRVDWRLMLPVGVGMVAAVLLLAGPIHLLVESFPLSAMGLFFGIVLVGIWAPLRMVRWSVPPGMDHVLLFGAAFVLTFVLTGLGGDRDLSDPSLLLVFPAAAIAICALIIPGVSGSFLLLAMGLYSPTLLAVSTFDLPYIGVFAAGALVGAISIVQVVLVALRRIPRPTVVVMAGLMAGSLRALWPWQADSIPFSTGDIVGPALFMVAGGAFVLAMMLLDRRAVSAGFAAQG